MLETEDYEQVGVLIAFPLKTGKPNLLNAPLHDRDMQTNYPFQYFRSTSRRRPLLRSSMQHKTLELALLAAGNSAAKYYAHL